LKNKIYSLLGFAARSNSLVFGKERIRGYIRSNREKKLVIIATNASERIKRDIKTRCESFGVKAIEIFTKEELGKLIGKEEITAFGIENDGIIDGILKNLGGK